MISGAWAITEAAVVIGLGIGIFMFYPGQKEPQQFAQYLTVTVIYSMLLWMTLKTSGLYTLDRIVFRPRRRWLEVSGMAVLVFLIMVLASFTLKVSDDFSRVWVLLWISSILIVLPVGRVVVSRAIRRSALAGELTNNIVIYGAVQNTERFVKHLNRLDEPWNRIVGVYDDRTDRVPETCAGYRVRGNTDDLVEDARRNDVDEVILVLPLASPERFLEIVTKLSPLPVNVRIVPDLAIFDFPQLPVSSSGPYGVPTISVLQKPVSPWGSVAKRTIDIVATSAAILLLLPLLLVVVALIKLDSRGPILFRQKRQGFNGELFDVYKFRSMYVDCADANAEKLTTRNDPRVTRVGAWIRRFSIDELPQLFNVLKGDMSLVGPRPHALQAKAGGKLYADVIDAYSVRMKVKPGLTGWAQVNGWRGNTETEEDLIGRVEHDLFYIENWSIALDFLILLKTVWIVFEGENSY